jgi:SWIM zinc finger
MIPSDEPSVDALAPNAEAAKNGRALIIKKKFLNYLQSAEGDLIFGLCQGSGKVPYVCSVDYARPDQPTYRCTCPSRQFPCKHCLGLLYAFAQKKPFTVAEVPEDLQAKRDKLGARAEKKAEEATKPKKVNTAALSKKVKVQLDGLETLEKLTHELVRIGIGNMNAKLASQLSEQAKKLGDVYLPGARAALLTYTQLFQDDEGTFQDKGISEAKSTEALDQLTRLNALIKQGRVYLTKQLEDPNLALPTDTAIAAWLGHAWHLTELKGAGLVEAGVELVQLAFHSHFNEARQEYIDAGLWMTLGTGAIRTTQTLRPIKAVKFIKSEDSFFQVAQIAELCVYPGLVNPRIRWDAMTSRPLASTDLQTVRKHAKTDFAAVVKEIKNILKQPLAERCPVVAVAFKTIGKVGDQLVLEDASGQRLMLSDDGIAEEPPSVALLSLLPQQTVANQVMIVRFRHDMDTMQLRVKPLSIVTEKEIIRLTL